MGEFVFDLQRFSKITNSSDYALVNGTSGDDFIDNEGKDVLINGDAGRDTILGGYGKDTIIGGKGNDLLQGGDGADTFVYMNGDGNDLIVDYAEEDIININSGTVSKIVRSDNDLIFTVGKGKISLMNAADKVVSYIESGTKKTYGSSGGGDDDEDDEEDSKLIMGTNGADEIENSQSAAQQLTRSAATIQFTTFGAIK